MTSNPYQSYPPAEEVAVEPRGATSNLMGLIGFILSLVAFITCGILSPIALIVSVIGLFKPPRGFAVAGTILSLIGSVFLLLVGLGTVMAFMAGDIISVEAGREAIVQRVGPGGVAPTDAEGQAMIDAELGDAERFFTVPQYRRVSDTSFQLVMPGEDGQFGTADDEVTTVDLGTTN